MILKLDQIIDLYFKNPNKGKISKLREDFRKLDMHVNGIGVDEYIKKIEGYENNKQHSIRKKLARSNKNTFASIGRPIDKIFSAKGGSIIYDMPDSKKEEFRNKLNNANGSSVKDFLKYYWRNRLWTDPNGIILIEHSNETGAYPTYKSIANIREYGVKGQDIDFIIFEPYKIKENNEDVEYVRVIDDSKDYTFRVDENKLTEIPAQTYKNRFNKVPGFVISGFIDAVTGYKMSPIDGLVEVADDLLIESSVYSIFKKLHGYPVFWRITEECRVCRGTGLIDGKKCPSCDGKGVNLSKDVTDQINLAYPQADEQKITPDVAGYVSPPIDTWVEMRNELEYLKRLLDFAEWGSNRVAQGEERTATETLFVNIQPVNERLNEYSDQLEIAWKKIIDYLGLYYYGSTYKGCSVNVGRRFYFESPDQIFKKYTDAKAAGVNEITLTYLLKQYYQAEFQNDEPAQVKMMQMLAVEPFPHNSKEEIKNLEINQLDFYAKVYFPQWIKTVDAAKLVTTAPEKLTEELYKYAQNKLSETNTN